MSTARTLLCAFIAFVAIFTAIQVALHVPGCQPGDRGIYIANMLVGGCPQ